jgi:hypothetical protein
MVLESKIENNGGWTRIHLVSVKYGFYKMLKGDKWVNTTDELQRFETVIITLGERFLGYTEAEAFTKTKAFKAIFKAVEENWV